MSDPDFVERKRRRRQRLIRFHEKQQRLKHWIGCVEIADWIACDRGANERPDETLREQAYRDLLGSVMEGAFDNRWGRTRVLYLDPDDDEPKLWLTKERLRAWLNGPVVAGTPTVIKQVLPRCWIYRTYARAWFERTGRPWPKCFDPIADPSRSSYLQYFCQETDKRMAEIRARDAADSKKRWITYSESVRFVLPVLFGRDWVGFASDQEHVVLSLGPSHPDWPRYSMLFAEREAQIAGAERWLLVEGLIDERDGRGLVQAERLDKALAKEASNFPPATDPEPRSAPVDRIRAVMRVVYKEERDPPNKVKVVSLVKSKLAAVSLQASGRQIQKIADEPEFKKLRAQTGVRREFRKS
jgi:hypothetical protein